MNTLHAGLMCTLLLMGTIAGLFGCMSAVRCHRRFAFAVCLAIASLDFAVLAVLLSRLPESGSRIVPDGAQPFCVLHAVA